MEENRHLSLWTKRVQIVSYSLSAAGILIGAGVHLVFSRHDSSHQITALGLLWTLLPFLLCAATAYVVRQFWLSELAVAVVTFLVLLICWNYRVVIEKDDQPYFILDLPILQLLVLFVLLLPVLTATLFVHQRRQNASLIQRHCLPSSKRD